MHSESDSLGEFAVIQRFFKTRAQAMHSNKDQNITLGIGDDCALLKPVVGEEIAITSDMLVEGRHFFRQCQSIALGSESPSS